MNVPVITPVALYYAGDRKSVVLEGDKNAAFLIANAGQQIPQGHLAALGLLRTVKTETLTEKEIAALTGGRIVNASTEPPKNSDPKVTGKRG